MIVENEHCVLVVDHDREAVDHLVGNVDLNPVRWDLGALRRLEDVADPYARQRRL